MKKRVGFVSNSSSSSFLMYGVCLDKDEATKRMSAAASSVEKAREIEEYGAYEMLYKQKKGLFFSGGPDEYADVVYVGLSWDSVKDDETGAQFKARAEEKLSELFGEGLSFWTFKEAWYNG